MGWVSRDMLVLPQETRVGSPVSAFSVVALGLAGAVITFSRGWAQIMLRNPLRGSHCVLYFSVLLLFTSNGLGITMAM